MLARYGAAMEACTQGGCWKSAFTKPAHHCPCCPWDISSCSCRDAGGQNNKSADGWSNVFFGHHKQFQLGVAPCRVPFELEDTVSKSDWKSVSLYILPTEW